MITLTQHPESMHNYINKVYSGFQMTFENGNTISVQFGCGNYCTNNVKSRTETVTAEIAIWNKSGKWYKFKGGNTVMGYCFSDDVAKWIKFASTKTIK